MQDTAPTKRFVVLSIILGIGFALFFSVMLLFNFQGQDGFPGLLFFFTAVSAVGAACVYAGLDRMASLPRWFLRIVAIGGVLLLLAAQLRLAKALYGTIAYDFNYLYVASRDLARLGTLGGCEEYFARFPNNVFLVLVFSVIIRVCDALGFSNLMAALVGCNLIVVDLSILLACLCAKKMFGGKAAALTLLFSVPLIGLHYGIVCPYSDTFGMFFPLFFLFLYLYMPKKEIAAWAVTALMGIAAVIGFKVKPQTIIIAVAAAVVEFFWKKLGKDRLFLLGKRLLCFCAAALIALTSLEAVTRATTGNYLTKELQAEKEAPFTHYLMMGLNPDTTGFFSSEDWAATNELSGKAAKTAYNLQVVGERLKKLGILGYGKFLLKKAKNIFYTMRLDMWVRAPFASEDPLSTALQQAFCQGGAGFPVYQRFLQSLWVLILLLWSLPVLFCRGGYRNKYVAVLRLSVAGLALFLLLFEGGPRYLYHQFPLFILLAVWGLLELPDGLRSAYYWCREWVKRFHPSALS